jgi:hypothetical protein
MRKKGLTPNVITFSLLIEECAKKRDIEGAQH